MTRNRLIFRSDWQNKSYCFTFNEKFRRYKKQNTFSIQKTNLYRFFNQCHFKNFQKETVNTPIQARRNIVVNLFEKTSLIANQFAITCKNLAVDNFTAMFLSDIRLER